MRFSWPTAALALLTWGLLAICPAAADDDVAQIKQRGTIVMLCVPHQDSHFVSVKLDAGPMRKQGTVEHFQGVDVDLMAAFAHHLGVDLEIRPAIGEDGLPSYRTLIQQLRQGAGDVGASSLSITDRRRQFVDFSDPYHSTRPVVIARRDSDLTVPDQLPGRRASTIPGSSQEEHLRKSGMTGASLHHVDFMLENYAAVQSGTVDFTLVDAGSAERVLPEFPDLHVVFPLPLSDDYGIAVAKGSDLLPALNAFLAQMRTSGELARIIDSAAPAVSH